MRDYTVCYPSGKVFTVRGDTLTVVPIPDQSYSSPCIERHAENRVVMLDPRAHVILDGAIAYTARRYLDLLPAWVVEWLREHPEWPPR